MLLYAQRDYMSKRFKKYNPARKDLWKDHNRPWDYDHILPHVFFYNRKDGKKFMKVCQEWGNTIGNLRAWPFEDNRSDQTTLANEKLRDEEKRSESFIESKEECDAFSVGDSARTSREGFLTFANVCRNRLVRIYNDWYSANSIEDIVRQLVKTTTDEEPSSTVQ
jgi:hypothetical protein